MKSYHIENSLTYSEANDHSIGGELQAITDEINKEAVEQGFSDDHGRMIDEICKAASRFLDRHYRGEYEIKMLRRANLRVVAEEVEVEED